MASHAGANAPSIGTGQDLGPDAFKKLYPEQYYKRFLANGVRPDGRAFGRARPTTIGLEAVSTADASALVKIGSTTVLAGIKLEVCQPVWLKSLNIRPKRCSICLAGCLGC